MTKNMGTIDRAVRTIIALTVAWLVFNNTLTGTWSYVLLVVAFVFLLTSLFSFCPLYRLVGMNTCTLKR